MITTLLFSAVLASSQHSSEMNKTYLLGFHADWCSKCETLGPKVMGIAPDLMKSGIEIMKIDRTSDKAYAEAMKSAKKMKLDVIAKQYEGTGYGVFVNARDKRVVGKVTSDMTLAQIKQAAKTAVMKQKTKLYAVGFHADWCSKCETLGPKAMGAMKEMSAMGAELIKLDLTNDKTKKSAEEQVKWLGITDVYKKNAGTGFILLIDPISKKAVGRINADVNPDKVASIVKSAVSKTTHH